MADHRHKNWFQRHKIASLLLGLVAVVIVVSAFGGGEPTQSNSSSSNAGSTKNKTFRFADRADKQDKDTELSLGETGTIDGVKIAITNIESRASLSEYDVAPSGKTYIVATVALENTSNRAKPYNVYDFRIQTAGGQVLDASFRSVEPMLNSGDLVQGGKVTGNVVFEAPTEDGHQYIIWKPGFVSERAIIQVK